MAAIWAVASASPSADVIAAAAAAMSVANGLALAECIVAAPTESALGGVPLNGFAAAIASTCGLGPGY